METAPTAQKTDVKKRFITFEHFGRYATILGFIVDTMTLGSSLLAITSILLFATGSNSPTVLFSNVQLTAFHAFIIWVSGVFSYLGMLHGFWIKHRTGHAPTFWRFMWSDLIQGFKHPFRLLPFVIALMLLLWIVDAAEAWGWLSVAAVTALMVTPIVIATYYDIASPKKRRFRRELEQNWPEWDKRIQAQLQGHQFFGTGIFQDVMEVWDIKTEDVQFMLAKYATKHPTVARFGSVRNTKQGRVVGEKVLINLKTLDKTTFSID